VNAESVLNRLRPEAEEAKAIETEVYMSLVEVLGKEKITPELYEKHQFAINYAARDAVNLRSWASGLTYRCIAEDREAKEPTRTQIEAYPEDGIFSDTAEKDFNIFNIERPNCYAEGTLFERRFTNQGLCLLRLYHQSHRNILIVRKVELSGLLNKMGELVANYTPELELPKLQFTLNAEGYKARIKEFNAEFGQAFRLMLLGERAQIWAEFSEPPETLAETFARLAGGKACMGPMSPYVAWDHKSINIFNHQMFENPQEKYSAAQGAGNPSLIRLFIAQEDLLPVLVAYGEEKIENG
jgi:hypothetical protein